MGKHGRWHGPPTVPLGLMPTAYAIDTRATTLCWTLSGSSRDRHAGKEARTDMTNPLPPIDDLKRLLDFDEESVKLIWKPRGGQFETLHAGREAGRWGQVKILGVRYASVRLIHKLRHGVDPPGRRAAAQIILEQLYPAD